MSLSIARGVIRFTPRNAVLPLHAQPSSGVARIEGHEREGEQTPSMLARAGYKGDGEPGMKAPLQIGSEDPGYWLSTEEHTELSIEPGTTDTSMGSEGPRKLPCPWRETPCIESPTISEVAGCKIFCKLENLQPSGSFKSRGIGNLIRQSILEKPEGAPLHFYCTSGGNAGLAAVGAAKRFGYPCTVVLPVTISAAMIAKLRAAGATDVQQIGDSWMEADVWLRENLVAKDPNGIYVPPFDHPWVFEGAASIVSELHSQLHGDVPDAIVCSVGGGGLFSGIMQGVDQYEWTSTRVLAMETSGTNSLNNSLQHGENTTLPKVSGIATSLGAKRVSDTAFKYAQRRNVISALVTDAEAAMGCWRFIDGERLLVEAACGASLAPCYNGMLKKLIPDLTSESKVVIIVCGGSGIDTELLEQYRKSYALADSSLANDAPVSKVQVEAAA